jgi:hypothetical protein
VTSTFHLNFILEVVNEENHKTPVELKMAETGTALTLH